MALRWVHEENVEASMETSLVMQIRCTKYWTTGLRCKDQGDMERRK